MGAAQKTAPAYRRRGGPRAALQRATKNPAHFPALGHASIATGVHLGLIYS
ncbi:hypothetical protein AB395_00003808 [Sinorhizobium fredii CCBAU 45436]|nr:hypothetical protein AB395_00003808 [Sinorhizobium fredii CCBAU 45436]